MKKIGFNVFLTAVALAVGVCSFASMPRGSALSERKKNVYRGLSEYTPCQGCYSVPGCKEPQPVPTKPPKDLRATVIICKGTPRTSRYAAWSQTQELDASSDENTCEGASYNWKPNDQGVWAWRITEAGTTPLCGTYKECNDREGGWKTGGDGEIIDGREDYRNECDKKKPKE